jgi:flagellin-like hook-associated protein FlgL
MILTNVTALQSQVEQTKAQDNFSKAARRLSSGVRSSSSAFDAGGLSQASRMQSEKIIDQSYRLNLQNARSYLLTQQEGLQKVLKIYDRMETLSIRAMDTTVSDADRTSFNDEFTALVEQLEEMMSSTYQGRRLYNATLLCGGVKNIGLEEGLDLANINSTWSHAIRSQTVDVHSSTGTLTFRVNSGGSGDIYRVWMGDKLVLSLGSNPPNDSVDHRLDYNTDADDPDDYPHIQNVPDGYSFGTGWATSGSANNGDDDIIEVSFGPEKPTTYKIYLGDSNSRPDGKIHKNQDVDDSDGDGNTTEGIWHLRTTWQSTDTATFTHDSDGDGVNDSPALEITDDQRNALLGIPVWNTADRDNNTDRSDYQNWANDWTGAEYEGDLTKKYGDPDAGYYTNIPNIVFTNDLPEGFESTDLTLQIETETIGIIYQEGQAAPYDENDPSSPIDPDNTGTPGIKFVPEHPDLEIPIDHQGNKIGIAAKSFGTLYSESPVYGEFHSLETAGKAADTLDHLRGNGDYYGEARCVIDDRLSAVASELNRIDQEIEKLEEREVQNIAAIGKIVDTDMAADATELAKSKIRSDLATSCISKSIGINDALISLTTKHFRGSILKT